MATFQTTHIVYFSPTHTSEKIARAIGEGIGMERRIETDLTLEEGISPIEIKDSLTIERDECSGYIGCGLREPRL